MTIEEALIKHMEKIGEQQKEIKELKSLIVLLCSIPALVDVERQRSAEYPDQPNPITDARNKALANMRNA